MTFSARANARALIFCVRMKFFPMLPPLGEVPSIARRYGGCTSRTADAAMPEKIYASL